MADIAWVVQVNRSVEYTREERRAVTRAIGGKVRWPLGECIGRITPGKHWSLSSGRSVEIVRKLIDHFVPECAEAFGLGHARTLSRTEWVTGHELEPGVSGNTCRRLPK